MVSKSSPLIFERSKKVDMRILYLKVILRTLQFPLYWMTNIFVKIKPSFLEVAELDLVRHYTELSNKNFGVDTGFIHWDHAR